MKILITTDLYTTATNGVVTSIKNLTDELVSRGHDIRILTLSEKMHSRKEGNVYYIRSIPFAVYPNVRMPISFRHRLIKEIVGWKPDVIHSQCEFFSFQFASYISKKTLAPIVHTYHTLYEQYVAYVLPYEKLGHSLVRVISRNRLKNVNTIVAPTHKVEDTLQTYGVSGHICVVPSGISLDQHKERISEQKREEMRASLGIPKDALVLLNLGRLGTEKNLTELLKYFSEALKTNGKMYFLIVGDGPAKSELETLAGELGIGDKVVFAGMIPPTEVQNYYQLGDIFISASTSETQGLTYIEAAANGLPLLCRQDKCLDDVLIPGENGEIFTSETDFINGLNMFVEHPERKESASRKSVEIAEGFDKKKFADHIEQIYKSVL